VFATFEASAGGAGKLLGPPLISIAAHAYLARSSDKQAFANGGMDLASSWLQSAFSPGVFADDARHLAAQTLR
jgi:hypothetical protein